MPSAADLVRQHGTAESHLGRLLTSASPSGGKASSQAAAARPCRNINGSRLPGACSCRSLCSHVSPSAPHIKCLSTRSRPLQQCIVSVAPLKAQHSAGVPCSTLQPNATCAWCFSHPKIGSMQISECKQQMSAVCHCKAQEAQLASARPMWQLPLSLRDASYLGKTLATIRYMGAARCRQSKCRKGNCVPQQGLCAGRPSGPQECSCRQRPGAWADFGILSEPAQMTQGACAVRNPCSTPDLTGGIL